MNYMVIIVDNPEIEISKVLDMNNLIFHKGDGKPCKHLTGNKPGSYKCNIHHYPWFKKTPCAEFTQIETRNLPCRVGEYHLKSHATITHLKRMV